MCWKTLLHWFINNKLIPDRVRIPHPEEPPNLQATAKNMDIEQVRSQWLKEWQVPKAFWSGWRTINIILVEGLTVVIGGQYVKVPAATVAEERRISVDPHFANPGILAHEMAHVSYSFLSLEQKAQFVNAFKEALATNSLLKLLYSQKTYMQQDSIETHADCYRYMGTALPDSLKGFYPKLF